MKREESQPKRNGNDVACYWKISAPFSLNVKVLSPMRSCQKGGNDECIHAQYTLYRAEPRGFSEIER